MGAHQVETAGPEAGVDAELRDTLARLLGKHCDIDQVRRVVAGGDGWDPALWSELAGMGVVGLATPAEAGGQSGGARLAALAQEELGRRLAPVPLLSSIAAQAALLAAAGADGEAAAGALLPRVASGEDPAAVLVGRSVDGWRPPPGLHGRREPGGWRLSGVVEVVADAGAARLLLAAAQTEAGPAMFAAQPATAVVSPLEGLDPTRPLARLELAGPAILVAGPAAFPRVFTAMSRAALVALAAEAVGVGAAASDLAVSYAKVRQQFGRPIGTYQAVSHRCADIFVAVAAARALVIAAAEALDAADDAGGDPDDGDLDLAVWLAAAEALDAAVTATQACLQIHGGIGFTWEHPTHQYLRRAKANEALIAVPDRLREHAARRRLAAARA